MHATHTRKTNGCRPDSLEAKLDPDPLPLAAHSLSQVVHLRAHDVVDCFASAIDILANRIGDVVNGDRLDKLFSAVTRRAISTSGLFAGPSSAVAAMFGHPPCARCCAVSRPSRSLESCKGRPLGTLSGSAQNRRDRPAATRTRAKNQSDDGAYCCSEHRCCQQVKLLLALIVRARLADGRAGAASPTRSRLQCICHPDPPPYRMPGLFPCALHGL